jgi:hypothetical protein
LVGEKTRLRISSGCRGLVIVVVVVAVAVAGTVLADCILGWEDYTEVVA